MLEILNMKTSNKVRCKPTYDLYYYQIVKKIAFVNNENILTPFGVVKFDWTTFFQQVWKTSRIDFIT